MTEQYWLGHIKRDHLAAILKRTRAADKGPWHWEGPSNQDWPHGENSLIGPNGVVAMGWGYDASGIEVDAHNADFIAHSREDIPALLALIRGLCVAFVRDPTRLERADVPELLQALDTPLRIVAIELTPQGGRSRTRPRDGEVGR